jgi:hypothetical protein
MVVKSQVGQTYIFAFLFFLMHNLWVLGYVNGDIYDQEVDTADTYLRLLAIVGINPTYASPSTRDTPRQVGRPDGKLGGFERHLLTRVRCHFAVFTPDRRSAVNMGQSCNQPITDRLVLSNMNLLYIQHLTSSR